MEVMQMTSLWLLLLTTAAGSDSLLSSEVSDPDRVMTLAKQQEQRIQQLEAALDGFNQKNNALVLSQQASRVEQLEAELENLKREYTNGTYDQPRNSPVAFTAALSGTFSGSGDGAVVPYGTVFLNHGEAYSATDYHFTAPVRGLYWFTVSVATEKQGNAELTVNGNSRFIAEDFTAQHRSGGAVSVILMLEAGDRVACVKTLDGFELTEHRSGRHFNTFTGFLYAQL